MTTQNTLPAKAKADTIRALLESDQNKRQLALAVPKHLPVERLLRVAMTCIRTTPKLLECTPQSLLACVMGCAQLGLEPEPFLGQAYLVPFYSSKTRTTEAQLIPGYRGYIALARRSGEVQSVSAQVVYEKDHFRLQYGLDEVLEHIPASGDRGTPAGAYVIFRYKDGSHSFDYMTTADIEKVRKRSKAGESGPWVTDWPEMAKKTVIRRHVKLVPLSVEIAGLAAAEDRAYAGESQISMFTPEAEPDEPSGGPVIDMEAIDSFNKDIGARDLSEDVLTRLDEFLDAAAQANKTDRNTVKAEASTRMDEFFAAFMDWAAKNPPAQDAEPGKSGKGK